MTNSQFLFLFLLVQFAKDGQNRLQTAPAARILSLGEKGAAPYRFYISKRALRGTKKLAGPSGTGPRISGGRHKARAAAKPGLMQGYLPLQEGCFYGTFD